MTSKTLNRITKILLVLGMVAGLILSVAALAYFGTYADLFGMDRYGTHLFAVYTLMLGILFVLGALYIGITLYRMLCTLDGDPFVAANVRALHRMGITALLMELCCLLLLWIPANTILVQLVGAAIALCGLFSLTLSRVFAAAVAHKQELDLTV